MTERAALVKVQLRNVGPEHMAKSKAAPPAVTPCRKCPLRALKGYREFTAPELAFMEVFKSGELKLEAGATILSEGSNSDNLYTVLSGWAFKYKSLPDGRRQVTNYALPGDLLGLQATAFDEMKHSVDALTDITLCVLPRKKLWMKEYLVSVGQRKATERLAFVLLDLFRRARRAGLARKNKVELPVTQLHLSETIGFSLVHTNKSLRRLRQEGCFAWTGTDFEVRDEKALEKLALYEPSPEPVRPFL